MKSVIAQGATVAKAVEEAVKKAGNPKEFFIKILQESQGGFLGFGSVKAKIALFFKKNEFAGYGSEVLSQDSYQGLFNNKKLKKQVEDQDKIADSVQSEPVKKEVVKHRQPLRRRPIHKKVVNNPAENNRKSADHIERTYSKNADRRNNQTRVIKDRADQPSENKEQDNRDQSSNRLRTSRRSTHTSVRRPRQGSRWGINRDRSKKRDDSDNS